MNPFSALDWQKKIYLSGFSGKLPLIKIDPVHLEEAAKAVMSPQAYAYIAGGAGVESTMRSNRNAFESFKIVPRMLKNVGERDISIDLFGKKLSAPFLLSPMGVSQMVHPEADLAVGRAAARLRVPYIFSNQASRPMEEVASAMGNSPRWFQLYWSKSNELVKSFVQRAEKCGCDAIVVTLDTTMLGWRTRDLELAYLPFLEGKGIAQYTSDPVFQQLMDEPDTQENAKREVTWQTLRGLVSMVDRYPGKGFLKKLKSIRKIKVVQKLISTYFTSCTTWDHLKFLPEQIKLPILLKGILHPDDARKAVEYGMNGIVVSNHGGRQVDGSVSTFEMLKRNHQPVGHHGWKPQCHPFH